MAWIESHQTLKEHPKIYDLMSALGISKPTAIGHLHLLWYWTVDYAPGGRITVGIDKIAKAAEWNGEPEKFVDALVRCRLLERIPGNATVTLSRNADVTGEQYQVHDWDEFRLHFDLVLEKRDRQRDQVRERVRKYRERHGFAKNDPSPGSETPGNAIVTHTVTQSNAPKVTKRPNITLKRGSAIDVKAMNEEARSFFRGEIESFFRELGEKSDSMSADFWDHFESNGWKIGGKSPMMDWKAAARRWRRRSGDFKSSPSGSPTNRFGPRRDESAAFRARSTYHCPKCDMDHPVSAPCLPGRISSVASAIGRGGS